MMATEKGYKEIAHLLDQAAVYEVTYGIRAMKQCMPLSNHDEVVAHVTSIIRHCT